MLWRLFLLVWSASSADQQPPAAAKEQAPAENRRLELNLAGKTDSTAGESRRNENIFFNLVDNNALKELNIRLGASATLVPVFEPQRSYFGAELGNVPSATLHVAGAGSTANRAGFHGSAFAQHQNSVFSARTFFQVGGVQPAHENHYGVQATAPWWRNAWITLDANQQKLRGNVNGNVLVPRPDERTPLAADPAVRALLAHWLAAYPRELPNRTDINERALNTNAPQSIDSDNASGRVDQTLNRRDRLFAQYNLTFQHVDAFQLVAGQNPDTDTKSQRARLTWQRNWTPATLVELSAGFDRLHSLLAPEPNAIGPMVSVAGLETLGPQAIIPIDRVLNHWRYAGQVRTVRGNHTWTAGFGVLWRQLNGVETDAHRGFFGFSNDFGQTAIQNFRQGRASQYIRSIGDVSRGFRNQDMQFYAGDTWKAHRRLTLNFGLRYQPVTRPYEVHGRNTIPYPCDCNNLAPSFGFAWQSRLGVVRAAYGLQYGEIYPVTFQQVRFSPPGSVKIVALAPDLLNPLAGLRPDGTLPGARGNLYLLDPNLRTPYSHQYNFSWEPDLPSPGWRVQLGYVGSRSDKLLYMQYRNRGQVAAGIPQITATINDRRPDARYADIRYVLNGSRGYYDAARVTLLMPRKQRFSGEVSYWFSKALDLGSAYSNTAYDADSRISRSQSEFDVHRDMKGRSPFDQPHAFLARGGYDVAPLDGIANRWLRGALASWNVSAVALVKSGTPFTVVAGSDGPGYGNVDGNGGDRPNLLDPSILGRTVGNPDTSRGLLPRRAFSYMGPADAAGNLGRATFRKGKIANVNASLARSWAVASDKRLTLRAESINFFNTPQFAEPGAELANGNFGQITNTLNDGRTFRFGLQLGW